MKAVAPKSTTGSSLWITTSTKSTQRIGLLPSPVNTTKTCTLQHSHYTLHTLFTSTRVHSDRLIYALAGSLFDSRSPQPFGGTKMNPGFLKYQGTTAAEVLQFIITESYTAYWNEMNVKGIKFVVTSVNRTMDLHYRGMKDEIDELMLKGMKKAGAIEWFGAMLIPKNLCHAYEDEAVSNGIDFTFPSKALNIRKDGGRKRASVECHSAGDELPDQRNSPSNKKSSRNQSLQKMIIIRELTE